ncbi:hypothetical protein ABZZ80_34370, partial [Streptomyces sp. NPDC006356]
MAGDPLIELRDVNKYFGELHVLKEINLTVGKGEVVVVIGRATGPLPRPVRLGRGGGCDRRDPGRCAWVR